MELKKLEEAFEHFFEYGKVIGQDIHITIDITENEAKKGIKKTTKIRRYDISSQNTYIETEHTKFGNLHIVKSNGGEKQISENELEVKILKGIKDGQTFVMKGQGNIKGRDKGDLYIHINIV